MKLPKLLPFRCLQQRNLCLDPSSLSCSFMLSVTGNLLPDMCPRLHLLLLCCLSSGSLRRRQMMHLCVLFKHSGTLMWMMADISNTTTVTSLAAVAHPGLGILGKQARRSKSRSTCRSNWTALRPCANRRNSRDCCMTGQCLWHLALTSRGILQSLRNVNATYN